MFKVIAILASIASAAAFAPARVASKASALKMTFENEVGALPPVGFWDPLGLAADGDKAKFDRNREVEVKHGRVAQLAVLGYVFQEYLRFPGSIDLDGTTFASIPNGIAAIGAVPSFGWLQIIVSIGYWELIGWEVEEGGEAYEFGWGKQVLGVLKNPFEGATKREYTTKEIQNGRLAMIGIMALLTHDLARPAGEGLLVLHHF
jgi:hypothetical protein